MRNAPLITVGAPVGIISAGGNRGLDDDVRDEPLIAVLLENHFDELRDATQSTQVCCYQWMRVAKESESP